MHGWSKIFSFQRGIVAHEFGHALGFHHEQTRPDRDRYVRILNQNIKPSAKFNFKKYDWNKIDSYNVPYDYMSVMHYGQYVSFLTIWSSERIFSKCAFFLFINSILQTLSKAIL